DSRWSSLPIVAMTAHAMNGDRERCLQAGMNGYVSKPVNPAHLLATMEQYLAPHLPAPPPPQDHPWSEALERSSPRISNADPDLVESMLQLFLQLAPERMERLESAIERSDEETLSAEAKKIEAAAHSIAATAVGKCAHLIEDAATRSDFDGARAELARMAEAIRAMPSCIVAPAPGS
ncbi:MAG: Hpt domain-containing protein, partial [Bryobacteraceae bacterium]